MKNVVGFALGVMVGYKGVPWCVHVMYATTIVVLSWLLFVAYN